MPSDTFRAPGHDGFDGKGFRGDDDRSESDGARRGRQAPPPARGRATAGGSPLIFGAVTLACLLIAMVLSVHGQHPVLMIPIALACAVVFIRNGDGREHAVLSVPIPDEESRRDRPTA